jgi:hypothetical protein
VCHGFFGDGGCGPPEELDPCDPNGTACATSDLACTLIFQNSGIYLCLRTCSTVADCPNATTTCFDDTSAGGKYCFYNVCGPDWPLPFPPLSGPSYYKPCTVQSTDDGTCLPVESQLGTVGVCLQGGTFSGSGACSGQRLADGGVSELCPPGTLCASLPGFGTCTPICAVSPHGQLDGGGPNCGPGFVCTDVLNASYDFGQCFSSCLASGACCDPTVCIPGLNVCYP